MAVNALVSVATNIAREAFEIQEQHRHLAVSVRLMEVSLLRKVLLTPKGCLLGLH